MKLYQLLKKLPIKKEIFVYIFKPCELHNELVAYFEDGWFKNFELLIPYMNYDVRFVKHLPNFNGEYCDDDYYSILLDDPNSKENQLLKAVEEVLKNAN